MAVGVLGTAVSRAEFGLGCLPFIGGLYSLFQIAETKAILAKNAELANPNRFSLRYGEREPRQLSPNEVRFLTSEVKVYALSGTISSLLSIATAITALVSDLFFKTAIGLGIGSALLLIYFGISSVQCTEYRNIELLRAPS